MEAAEQVMAWKKVFEDKKYFPTLLSNIGKGDDHITLDFFDISKIDPALSFILLDHPEECFGAAKLAAEDLVTITKTFEIRIKNLPKSEKYRITTIRSKHLGKLICMEGVIRQISSVRPKVSSARFECPSCGNIINVIQLDSRFKEPSRCGCGRKGKFRMISKELIDVQRMIIEEPLDFLEGSEQPARLNILVEGSLVNPDLTKYHTPGTRVVIGGYLEDIPKLLKSGGVSTDRELAFKANHIETTDESIDKITINKEEEEEILALSKDPLLMDKLVASYAPSIEGHENIKLAIILQCFGAERKVIDGKVDPGLIHILLIGDPGSGKTWLLLYGKEANPKFRYAAGPSSSGAGMTYCVVRDEFIGGWALEAGSLVLGHLGVCAIDEFDKQTDEDRDTLHGAMTEGMIPVDKANIHASLPCETSILAAANPKYGRFDTSAPGGLASQIELRSTIINRFDLIFPILDTIEEDRDKKQVKRLIEVKSDPTKSVAKIPSKALKRYIAYAKKKIHPTFSQEAKDEIERFYMEIRHRKKKTMQNSGQDSVPINLRQVQTVMKLSEAAAKARLSQEVTKKDVILVEDILIRCLEKIALDEETGRIDIDRIAETPKSTRDIFITILDMIPLHETRAVEDILAEVRSKGIKEELAEELIQKLKRKGDIYEPRPGFLKKLPC